MQHMILQNALGIETNCIICSCSPGQAACSRFLWNPWELSFLHTQACCFHSSVSFTIFCSICTLYGAITWVAAANEFFPFFLMFAKVVFLYALMLKVRLWEWWHFYRRISWHPTSNHWLKVYGMVLFCIISSFLMISIC